MSAGVDLSQLQKVTLLGSFNESELRRLIEVGTTMSVEPYTNIVIEGELSWGMYLVLEGQVGIYKENKLSGNVYDVGHLQAGSFFGEMSLVDSQPRSATVQSLTQCRLFRVGKDEFRRLIDGSPELKLRFFESCIQQLVGRLRVLNDDYVVSQYQLWQKALKTGRGAA